MPRFRFVLVSFALASLTACGAGYPPAGTTPEPLSAATIDQAHARMPNATAESLEEGRQLFVSNCNRCHQYADRAAFTEDQFRSIVPRMARKAHLTEAQGELVLNFILADKNRAPSSGGESMSSGSMAPSEGESSSSPTP